MFRKNKTQTLAEKFKAQAKANFEADMIKLAQKMHNEIEEALKNLDKP